MNTYKACRVTNVLTLRYNCATCLVGQAMWLQQNKIAISGRVKINQFAMKRAIYLLIRLTAYIKPRIWQYHTLGQVPGVEKSCAIVSQSQ